MIDNRAETYWNASGKGEVFVSLKQTPTKNYQRSKTTMKSILCWKWHDSWQHESKRMVFTKQARIPRHGCGSHLDGDPKNHRGRAPDICSRTNSYTAAKNCRFATWLQVRSLGLQVEISPKKSTKKDSGQNSCLVGGFNPFEKYARQIELFPQESGWK